MGKRVFKMRFRPFFVILHHVFYCFYWLSPYVRPTIFKVRFITKLTNETSKWVSAFPTLISHFDRWPWPITIPDAEMIHGLLALAVVQFTVKRNNSPREFFASLCDTSTLPPILYTVVTTKIAIILGTTHSMLWK